jgi:hypothetical protein
VSQWKERNGRCCCRRYDHNRIKKNSAFFGYLLSPADWRSREGDAMEPTLQTKY